MIPTLCRYGDVHVQALAFVRHCSGRVSGRNRPSRPCRGAWNCPEALKIADWEKAKRVSLKLEDDLISPAWLRLKAGQPYILVLENTDGDSGTLRAADFFANAASNSDSTLGMVGVGAEEKREIRLLVLEKGVYDMDMGLFSTAWGILGKIEVY